MSATVEAKKPSKSGFQLDSLVLLFSIVILAQLATYVVPKGEFERTPWRLVAPIQNSGMSTLFIRLILITPE